MLRELHGARVSPGERKKTQTYYRRGRPMRRLDRKNGLQRRDEENFRTTEPEKEKGHS